jgi:HAD superfamily hydrolase (TIGR01549 family)
VTLEGVSGPSGIDWVILDVGETLVDESRIWATWAHVIGVSPLTFGAALGAAIARGSQHGSAFDILGVDDWRRYADVVEAELGGLQAIDLYPDALPAAGRLRERGFRVAIVANQPASRREQLLALGFEPDLIAMSEALGVAKPDDAFYQRALQLLGGPDPRRVAHVGDRVDNDVVPAARNGLRSVWLRRGPWGRLQQDTTHGAELVVDSLDELLDRLAEFGSGSG